jgi:hypothetical protein
VVRVPDTLITPRFGVFPACELAKVIPTRAEKDESKALRFLRGFLQAHKKLLTGKLAILDHYTNRQKCGGQNFVCAPKSLNVKRLRRQAEGGRELPRISIQEP